ncbi:hypothetical protein T10_13086, partial [Trichinella papuae]
SFEFSTSSSQNDKVTGQNFIFDLPFRDIEGESKIEEDTLKKLLEPFGKLYKSSEEEGTPISISEATLSVEKMITELNRLIRDEDYPIAEREKYWKLKTVIQGEKCDSTTHVYALALQKTDCEFEQILEGKSSTDCSEIAGNPRPLGCTVLSQVTSEDAKIIGAVCRIGLEKEFPMQKSLCQLSRYPGEEKFKTLVPEKESSWLEDVILYAPVGVQPNLTKFRLNYRGRQGIVGLGMLPHYGPVDMSVITIFRKAGEDTEVLSVLDSGLPIEIPKVFVSDLSKKPFGDEIDGILREAFKTTGLSSSQTEEKLEKLYSATTISDVEHRETPYDTDHAYVFTKVAAALDKSKEHIGSIDTFPSEGKLQIGWKKADKSALRLMKAVIPKI